MVRLFESPGIKEFLEDARQTGRLSKEEAMGQFRLSEPSFRKLASALLALGEIRSESGKGYFFSENQSSENTPLDQSLDPASDSVSVPPSNLASE